jgi:hypothetical protein
MGDLIFVAVVLGFFVLAVAYVRACERIVGRDTGVESLVDAETEAVAGVPEGTVGRAR